MTNTQLLRKISVKLEASGTATIISNTKLYKNSYGFVQLECYIAKTQNNTGTPLCSVYKTSIDSYGNRVNPGQNYNMVYIQDINMDSVEYMLFECPLPQEFTNTEGELSIVFNYCNVDSAGRAASILTTNIFKTTVAAGGWNNAGVALDATSQDAAQINANKLRLNNDVLQIAKDTATLPEFQAPYTKDGYKRLACEYKAEYQITKATSQVVTASGKVRAIDFVEYDFSAPEPNKGKAFQTEIFACEFGFYTRKITFNYSASHTYSTTSYAIPDWSPSSAELWQTQINNIDNINANHTASITALQTTSLNHETRITNNTSAIATLAEKENDRNHFKGMFNTPAELPIFDETNPKGATDNDYAYIISTATVWNINPTTHTWTDTLQAYPSDTTLIDNVTTPTMDGVASAGTSSKASPSGHIHPTDTTRAAQADLDTANTKIATAQKDITAINANLKNHATSLTNLSNRIDGNDTLITAIQTKDTAQDGQITALQQGEASINTEITAINTKNTEQDTHLTQIDAKTDTTNTNLSALNTTVNAVLTDYIKKSENAGYVITSASYALNGDELQITISLKCLKDNTVKTETKTVIVSADETHTGLMKFSYVNQLVNHEARLATLEISGSIYFVDLSGLPTNVPTADVSVQSYLTDVFNLAVGKPGGTAPIYGVLLKSNDPINTVVFEYSVAQALWFESFSTASLATNDVGTKQGSAGVSVGTDKQGGIRYDNGRPFLNGYDNLVTADTTNATAITEEITRAKAAETANATNISSQQTALASIDTRVKANEVELPKKVDKTATVAGKPLSDNVALDALNIQKNGVKIDEYNGSAPKTINIGVPVKTSELTNDGSGSGSPYAKENQIPSNYISTTGGQTINGNLSLSDPITAPNAATKNYVDNSIADLPKPTLPLNQQSEIIHLPNTSVGIADKFEISSEPTQIVSPNLLDISLPRRNYFCDSSVNGSIITLRAKQPYTDHSCSFLPVSLKAGKTYTVINTATIKSGTDADRTGMLAFNENFFELNKGETKTITLTKDVNNVILYLSTATAPTDALTVDWQNLMIVEGAYTAATFPVYQPYTGAPSPENPIPINVVSSPLKVISNGDNLINLPNATMTLKGLTATIKDGLISIQGTKTEPGDCYFYRIVQFEPINLVANIEYTISIDLNYGSAAAGNWCVVFLDKDKNNILAVDKSITIKTFSFTLVKLACYVDFILYVAEGTTPIGTVINTSSNLMLNIGATALPYTPYISQTTPLPLLTTNNTPVELLGTLNSRTNILQQKWKKIVFYGSEFWRTTGSVSKKYSLQTVIDDIHINNMNASINPIFSNMYIKDSPNGVYSEHNYTIAEAEFQGKGSIIIHDSAFSAFPSSDTWKAHLQELARWGTPLTVYYQLQTPEIITLQTLPNIPTLDGETNIFAVDNASPVTFNVTELLTGGARDNVVMRDENKTVQLPFTTAEQVEINAVSGITLDREIENIQASISDEAIARDNADIWLDRKIIANDKIYLDADIAIKNLITAESQSRNDADTSIRNELATLATADTAINTKISIRKGNIIPGIGKPDIVGEVIKQGNIASIRRIELAYGSESAWNISTGTNVKCGIIPEGFRPKVTMSNVLMLATIVPLIDMDIPLDNEMYACHCTIDTSGQIIVYNIPNLMNALPTPQKVLRWGTLNISYEV